MDLKFIPHHTFICAVLWLTALSHGATLETLDSLSPPQPACLDPRDFGATLVDGSTQPISDLPLYDSGTQPISLSTRDFDFTLVISTQRITFTNPYLSSKCSSSMSCSLASTHSNPNRHRRGVGKGFGKTTPSLFKAPLIALSMMIPIA